MLVNVINKLFEHSNHHIEIRYDKMLPMVGLSFIEKSIHGKLIPVILINLDLIPTNESVIAHILSHEWAHHVLRHISLNPEKESKEEIITKEKQADEYASSFCRKFKYNLDDIERFINQCPIVDFDRIKILRNKK